MKEKKRKFDQPIIVNLTKDMKEELITYVINEIDEPNVSAFVRAAIREKIEREKIKE